MTNGKKHCFAQRVHTQIACFPAVSAWILVGVIAVAWVLQCSFFQTILPLDVIEAINWGAQGALGNSKHPPLSGWLGYGFSRLFGRADWGMYFAAQLCVVVGMWYIYLLAKTFFDKKRAAIAVLMLLWVHYYSPSPMKFCTSFVEVALLPAIAYYFYRAVRQNKIVFWLLFGALSAAAVLNKYSSLCVIGTLLILMLLSPENRKRLLSPGIWLAGILFCILIAPHVHWLVQHDFCCLRHVGDRLDVEKHSPWFAVNVLLISLYPVAMGAVALFLSLLPKAARKRSFVFQREAFRWSVLLYALPVLCLVVSALLGNNVVTMWLFPHGIWAPIIVLAVWPTKLSRRSFRRIFYLTILYTVLLFTALQIDVMVKSRPRLHMKPAAMLTAVDGFWKTVSDREIGGVIGSRWYAGCVEHYDPKHPAAADIHDPYGVDLVLKKAAGKPLLLISDSKKTLQKFIGQYAPQQQYIERTVRVPYRAKLDKRKKTKTQAIYLIYLPEAPRAKQQ